MNAVAQITLVAWRVDIRGMAGIVFAATKTKAQWLATKSYWEGYGRRRGEWPRARAGRCPEYDGCVLKEKGPRAWSEEYVRDFVRLIK